LRAQPSRGGLAPLPSEVPETCRSKSRLGSCFPPEVRPPHGLPLLGRLRGTAPLPDVHARMQPSDSPAASSGALVPLATGLPRDERFCEPAGRALVYARRVGRLRCGSSVAPRNLVDRQGPPRLLGRPLHTCRGQPPRLGRHPLARLRWHLLLPSGFLTPWASRKRFISGLYSRGPHARLPTHQPSRYRGGCKADYRPAGLSFSRAGFAPAGQLIEFREVTA